MTDDLLPRYLTHVTDRQYREIYERGWRAGYRAGKEGLEDPASTIRRRLGLSCREKCDLSDRGCVCDRLIRKALLSTEAGSAQSTPSDVVTGAG